MKDDSRAYAAFTEQGSFASQLTAAKVMDVIAPVPDCDGQAADALSPYVQVKMEDAPKFLKIPKSECPDVWIRLPKHKWQSWNNISDSEVPLERKFIRTPICRTLVGKTVRKVSDGTWVGKSDKLGMLICSQTTKVILSGLCGRHQDVWKNAEFGSYLGKIDERR